MTSDQILSEQKNKSKTSLTISVVLIAAGAVVLLAKQMIGGLFIVIGAILAAGLMSRSRDIKAQLEAAGGKAGLDAQLAAEGTRVYDDLDLAATPKFIIVYRPFFKVYTLENMDKFEVGIGPEGVQKALFLTEADGTRHKIVQVQKGDGRQESFDALYEQVRDYFKTRAAE